MSFQAAVLRVFIASPSDLADERDAAEQAISEWNSLHASDLSVVLVPVRWETHATPQTGVRPQQAIIEQLVGEADVLIGLFWTKLGTDTGVAEAGTVEEIDQFVAARKPALLYFSRRMVDPTTIDPEQHRSLEAFKDATRKIALVGSFASPDELRGTLVADLLRQVRQMSLKRPSDDCLTSTAEDKVKLDAHLEKHKRELHQHDSVVLSTKSANSLKRYLEYRGAHLGDVVERTAQFVFNEQTAQAAFSTICEEAYRDALLDEAITDALGERVPFGLYVSTVYKIGDKSVYLNHAMKGNSECYLLEHVIDNFKKYKKDIEEQIKDGCSHPPHKLIEQNIAPLPLAAIVRCSTEGDWRAAVLSVNAKDPMLFVVDTSKKQQPHFNEAARDLLRGFKMPADEMLKLFQMRYTKKFAYIGTQIKTILHIPLRGRPSVTFTILTRARVNVAGATLLQGQLDSLFDATTLNVDELIAIRICCERFISFISELNFYRMLGEDRREITS